MGSAESHQIPAINYDQHLFKFIPI